MLQITIPDATLFDEVNSRVIKIKGRTIQLEHSLVSVSKWESKWKKAFISRDGRTREETVDYIRCMTMTQNVDPTIYYGVTNKNIQEVEAYINDPMTATTFKNTNHRTNNGVITSEIIYYWMISLEIPMECQKWHLNRLLTLIRVCDEKSQPGKKMSRRDVMKQNRALNAARRSRSGSRG